MYSASYLRRSVLYSPYTYDSIPLLIYSGAQLRPCSHWHNGGRARMGQLLRKLGYLHRYTATCPAYNRYLIAVAESKIIIYQPYANYLEPLERLFDRIVLFYRFYSRSHYSRACDLFYFSSAGYRESYSKKCDICTCYSILQFN